MKIFELKVLIETDDDWTIEQLKKELDYLFNRGDGIYMDLGKNSQLRMVKKIKENE